jgi:hypothetical protein
MITKPALQKIHIRIYLAEEQDKCNLENMGKNKFH